ncbi:hypothetical protein LSTR_LSTR008747 [Laodelphax striatellus]|uniref:Uncharacterized protein n=1 Tax=Laodelphax striatellus TaxID=195883 RepID=A0A482XPQ7_LAOST|nr:hypothetical protein LSTR_LSTR008747 [Laodelphax striatellus]
MSDAVVGCAVGSTGVAAAVAGGVADLRRLTLSPRDQFASLEFSSVLSFVPTSVRVVCLCIQTHSPNQPKPDFPSGIITTLVRCWQRRPSTTLLHVSYLYSGFKLMCLTNEQQLQMVLRLNLSYQYCSCAPAIQDASFPDLTANNLHTHQKQKHNPSWV